MSLAGIKTLLGRGGKAVANAAKDTGQAISARKGAGDMLLDAATGATGREWMNPRKWNKWQAMGVFGTSVATGSFLKGAILDPVRGMEPGAEYGKGSLREQLENSHRQGMLNLREQLHRREMQRIMMRLAASDPQTFQELMVGRKLPPGAMVLGGRRQKDDSGSLWRFAADVLEGEVDLSAPESRADDILEQLMQPRSE